VRDAAPMRRKGDSDALKSVNEPRWLVVRDRMSHVVSCQALAPQADLRAALNTERDRRVAQGWHAEASARHCAFFFCDRAEARVCVAIECFEPGSRSPSGWPRGG
jgi:hypothetical protein